ncbi:MAG: SH3 domain-containing protein [Myxococcota bacterium]
MRAERWALPLLLCALPAFADEPSVSADFQAANERALSGDTEGALALYKSLEDRGVDDPDFWLDYGTAFANAQKPIDAIVAFERGLRLAPRDPDLIANLEALRRSMDGARRPASGAEAPTVDPADAIEALLAPLGRDTPALLLVVFSALFFGALLLRRLSKLPLGAISVLLGIGLFISALACGGQAMVLLDGRSVLVKTTELKEGPHPKFKAVLKLAGGERLKIRREQDGWAEVRTSDGVQGWVAVDVLRRI